MSYKSIFFDWDGTAVESREASVDEVVKHMKALLRDKVNLIIISGTTYDKIAGGRLHEYFEKDELDYLYLGLGRGALNYSFKNGDLVLHDENMPSMEELLMIHRVAFEIHQKLLSSYGIKTDIVFSRPNYCKLDLMVEHDRGGKLFLQSNEINMIQEILEEHGIKEGLREIVRIAEEVGRKLDFEVKATTDAKFLEVGKTTKSDNVNFFIKSIYGDDTKLNEKICFWGDEFTYLAEGIKGSDAYMITELSKKASFFDVSENPLSLPEVVKHIGGGTKSFIEFLESQKLK